MVCYSAVVAQINEQGESLSWDLTQVTLFQGHQESDYSQNKTLPREAQHQGRQIVKTNPRHEHRVVNRQSSHKEIKRFRDPPMIDHFVTSTTESFHCMCPLYRIQKL